MAPDGPPLEPDDTASAPEGSEPVPTDPALDDAPLAPEQVLDIIREQRLVVRDRVEPDGRLLFGAWGTAWLVGYLVLFSTARDSATHTPAGWSFAVFFTLIAAAIAVTIVHTVRRSIGIAGPTGRSGAMYGWSWTIGFVAVFLIMTGLTRAGADPVVVNLGWNALPCLLVGVLYLASGALWQSTVLYVLGAWIVLVGGVATVVGLPATFLVMALAGGGGMFVGALATHVREYRGERRAGSRSELRSAP